MIAESGLRLDYLIAPTRKRSLSAFFHKNRKNATNIMTNTPFNVVQKVKNICYYFQRVYYLYPLFN